ncbi:flagellar FliL protein [Dongia mobilis]|uniref:Flagellar protein FliL n=1 Tax=Dongia mobilis TaxID=578943 RepID=A0A4R6WRZ9_9PROT|nr:flagellar basal body-associated FliL family protein [Dongia mobilis]TDQ84385.1 flagellar FliL protein [Dongia mobilis]
MAEAEGASEPQATKKKMSGKKLVLFIVLPLLLLAGGGAAAFLLLGSEEPEKAVADGEEAAEEEHAADPGAPPIFVELPEMTANLISNGKKGAFLRTTLVLELGNPEDQPVFEGVQPRVENEIQTYLRSLRPEDLQGAEGMKRLRDELMLRVKDAAKPARVKDILFKQILVQQ